MDELLLVIVLSSLVSFFGGCIYMVWVTGKAWKERKKQRKQDKANGIKRFSAIAHVEGLGVVENTQCSVVLDPSNLVISCIGKEYTLPLKRIAYVDFIADTNKIRYLQSSMARGIAGAALFGVSGAVIGSTPKSKVENEAIGYAVIGYRDVGGKEEVIILKDQSPNSFICSQLVKALTPCVRTQIEKVNL